MGHVRNYVIGDICVVITNSRRRSNTSMGWDAFESAENATIHLKLTPRLDISNIKYERSTVN